MIILSRQVTIPENEIELQFIRSQGAGGQNVNKVASAVHLRFDILQSSLPDVYKQRLLALNDQRITKQGIIIIKAQQYRRQDRNRDDALERLATLIRSVMTVQKRRIATKPTRAAKKRRLDGKNKRAGIKQLRKKITDD